MGRRIRRAAEPDAGLEQRRVAARLNLHCRRRRRENSAPFGLDAPTNDVSRQDLCRPVNIPAHGFRFNQRLWRRFASLYQDHRKNVGLEKHALEIVRFFKGQFQRQDVPCAVGTHPHDTIRLTQAGQDAIHFRSLREPPALSIVRDRLVSAGMTNPTLPTGAGRRRCAQHGDVGQKRPQLDCGKPHANVSRALPSLPQAAGTANSSGNTMNFKCGPSPGGDASEGILLAPATRNLFVMRPAIWSEMNLRIPPREPARPDPGIETPGRAPDFWCADNGQLRRSGIPSLNLWENSRRVTPDRRRGIAREEFTVHGGRAGGLEKAHAT
jgi:hypothetical protein